MTDGEFALFYDGVAVPLSISRDDIGLSTPFCSIFSSRERAEQFARQQVAAYPALRCRLFDHDGLGRPPLMEVRGAAYKGESEITPRIRRWLGGGLFVSGAVLTLVDWRVDFRYMWASTLGTRLMVPGGTLLVVEAAYQLNAAQKRRKEAHA